MNDQQDTSFPKWEEGKREKVVREIADVINRNSIENHSNTPDFILAEYAVRCLENFTGTSRWRERWYGRNLEPNQTDNCETKELNRNIDGGLPF